MTVVVNQAVMAFLLDSETGPVGREVTRRAELTTQRASENATGEVIGILSGRLQTSIRFQTQSTPEGARAVVGSDAVAYNSDGSVRPYNGAPFSYPRYWDQNGRPWLTQALREVFP
jgi:hypothetical protein